MATLPKVLERNEANTVYRSGTHQTASDSCNTFNRNSQGLPLQSSPSGIVAPPAMPRNPIVPQVPPPIPPRLATSLNAPHNRIGYGYSGYLPYGRLSTPAYSTYAGYGGMGSRFGCPPGPWDMGNAESALIRMAEESSRPAFQSIESIVNAVGSISMMLESTYHAVYSSYRAVLGVVEQFSRLRNHLTHVLSTLALLRSLHWLCLRVLYLLGIRKTNPSSEAAWSIAANAATRSSALNGGEVDPSKSSWPIFMFLALVFGAPWLIFHLFSKMAAKKDSESWTLRQGEPTYSAVALYDFQGAGSGELTIYAGQQITLAPKSLQPKVKGWVLANADGKTSGLVPSNYVRLIPLMKPPKCAAASGLETREQPSDADNKQM